MIPLRIHIFLFIAFLGSVWSVNGLYAQLVPQSPSKDLKLVRPPQLYLPLVFNELQVGHSTLINTKQSIQNAATAIDLNVRKK